MDPNTIRLLNLGPTAAWRTQAVYHATAEMMTADSPDTIIICQPLTPYLCLGYHQVYDAVLDRAECERRDLPVMRRRVGGGATYLDVNQLFYQCIFHHSRAPMATKDIYALMLAGPVATLRRLGLNAELRAVNEIEVEGKRIAGIGGGRIGEAAVVVGNLLFDFGYRAMSQVWRVPNEAFRDLAAAALRERITTIWRETEPVTADAVIWMLLAEFAQALGRPIERGILTQAETRRSHIVAERMMSAEYLDLHRDLFSDNGRIFPMTSLKISASVYIKWAEVEWDGRRVQASFRVREGIIEEARLQSESAHDWREIEVSLRGVAFKDWELALDNGA
ncbi:MAG: lipoate--protein ligase family protein [Chloroflexi bacterium]|nr:lipoate--protein ligase family protein [Chloroflexota bacterium]